MTHQLPPHKQKLTHQSSASNIDIRTDTSGFITSLKLQKDSSEPKQLEKGARMTQSALNLHAVT